MYNVGVVPGKFSPPHRGHLSAVIQAATKCKKLYVVVSHNEKENNALFLKYGLKAPSLIEKARWFSIELQNFPHIKVLILDESNIPSFPDGWPEWAELLEKTVPEKFDVIFGGEPSYQEGHNKYFPYAKYEIFDPDRSRFPISATKIRENPYENWDYILGAARPFFAKKVLLVGTESCGKTTLTKYLAKLFYTSWAEEAGRYYAERHLGGNEALFTIEDFHKIALEQRALEEHALRSANKIVFFDTDATVTQYYCEIYTGKWNNDVEKMIDPSRYDLVLYLMPDVPWVDDGQRFLGEQSIRDAMDEKLYKMFIHHGFGDKIKIISGSYNERLETAIALSEKLLQRGL